MTLQLRISCRRDATNRNWRLLFILTGTADCLITVSISSVVPKYYPAFNGPYIAATPGFFRTFSFIDLQGLPHFYPNHVPIPVFHNYNLSIIQLLKLQAPNIEIHTQECPLPVH